MPKGRGRQISRVLLCGTAGWVAAIVATPASSQTRIRHRLQVHLPPATSETSPPPPFKAETVQSPKFTEPLLDTPRTINVIPKAVIEQRGATSINEVLRQVPGISLGAAEGGLAAGDRTFIRGYEARGDTFVDGFRDFGQYFRDPFNIEQVEVLKGPGSTISGRGSTGGIINYVTKQPLKEDLQQRHDHLRHRRDKARHRRHQPRHRLRRLSAPQCGRPRRRSR